MRRAFDYITAIVLYPILALLGFGLLVADPFRFTQYLTAAGQRLRPLFEPDRCNGCRALLTANANDEHAGYCCNCQSKIGGHSVYCKGRTAE